MNDKLVPYVLDTSVFVEASRRYYAFDIAPSFWEKLEAHSSSNSIMSIDRVEAELAKGNDELAEWAKNSFYKAFATTNDTIVSKSYGDIMKWVNANSQFRQFAKAEFARGADGWLIAFAKVNGNTIVTQEEFKVDIRKKVPIPNVCSQFNIPYINTFKLVRDLGITLG